MQIPKSKKRAILSTKINIKFDKYSLLCGYFGQLNNGRGIEIIEFLSRSLPDYYFLVFGGNDDEVNKLRKKNIQSNLKYMGYFQNHESRKIMCCLDALLMPYQNKVYVGKRDLDTSQWMSPMKMFEYLASGVPILSSDLNVLKEVLKDNENSLLIDPLDHKAWKEKLIFLEKNPKLAFNISKNAHIQYKHFHTWGIRAKKILELYK